MANIGASADTGNQASESEKRNAKQLMEQQADAGSTGSDEVLNITQTKKSKKKRKSKGQIKREAEEKEAATGEKRRKVVFKLENNTSREFHTHSKVATRALPNVKSASTLKSAIKKPREDKLNEKLKKK